MSISFARSLLRVYTAPQARSGLRTVYGNVKFCLKILMYGTRNGSGYYPIKIILWNPKFCQGVYHFENQHANLRSEDHDAHSGQTESTFTIRPEKQNTHGEVYIP
ncbi:hypothetical protein VTP01DRAFT_7802 [Rhizomucor pusillus]|uniref:uncharacterized protein n=1 Tax=Rhizomucor pusillus TaxID=4840 RepID=UPI0037430BC9